MKEQKTGIAVINNVEELILKKPKLRSDKVRITQAGMREHATEISIEDFEAYTGKYFKGLEPESNSSYETEISRLKKELSDIGFEVIEKEETDNMYGIIDFSTSQNNKFSVIVMLSKTSIDGSSRFTVQKNQGRHRNSSFSSECRYPEHAVDNILEKVKEYTNTMTQNLTAGEKIMASSGNVERSYSKDNVPMLFPNETLSDYFKKQDMPAGAVVNSKGRYQIFSTYMTFENKMVLHYETKDYANKKNAERALEKLGYSIEGKQLDCLDIKELKDDISVIISREFNTSWSDNIIGSGSTRNAILEFSNIIKSEDDKFGVNYFIEILVTDRLSGQSLKIKNPIDAREGGNTYSITRSLTDKALSAITEIKNNTIQFDPDNRSKDEKLKFHQDQSESHIRMINHYEKQLSTNNNPHYEKTATESLEWEKEMLSKHIDSKRSLEENSNEFSM